MIKIQLEYDNIEDSILALSVLRDKNLAGGITPAGNTKIKVTEKKTEEPAPGKSVKTDKPAASPATAAATPATPPAAAAAPKPESTSGASVDYAAVTASIQKYAALDKPKVIAVLASDAFKAKSGKDLKPEQYADFIAALDVAFGTGEADLT